MIKAGLIALSVFLLLGCGQEQTKTTPAEVELMVVRADGSKDSLICPGDKQRCGKLKISDLQPLRDDVVCAQVYGGPERAQIRGTAAGRKVNLDLSRTDSCRIDQWDRLAWLIGEAKQSPAGPR